MYFHVGVYLIFLVLAIPGVSANEEIKVPSAHSITVLTNSLPEKYTGSLKYSDKRFSAMVDGKTTINEMLVLKDDQLVFYLEMLGVHVTEDNVKGAIELRIGSYSMHLCGYQVGSKYELITHCNGTVDFYADEDPKQITLAVMSMRIPSRSTSAKFSIYRNGTVYVEAEFPLPGSDPDHWTTIALPKPLVVDKWEMFEFSATRKTDKNDFAMYFDPGTVATTNYREKFVPPTPRPKSVSHKPGRRCPAKRTSGAELHFELNLVFVCFFVKAFVNRF